MPRESIAFNKMKALRKLERYGVALGEGYKNDLACATFTEYISQDLRRNLTEAMC